MLLFYSYFTIIEYLLPNIYHQATYNLKVHNEPIEPNKVS